MTRDQPVEQRAQRGVARGERQIGIELRRAVAQPQARDIAGDHERVGLAVDRPHRHRRVERVGVASGEQRRELGVRDPRRDTRDLRLHRRADEAPIRGRRPPRRHLLRCAPDRGQQRTRRDRAGLREHGAPAYHRGSACRPVTVKRAATPAATPGCPPPTNTR